MNTYRVLVMLVALLSAPRATTAAERGPSTPEERAKVVRLTHTLEVSPLAEDAGAMRGFLLQWVTDVPDIHVKVCVDLVGPALDDKYAYSSEVSLHMALAAAVFVIDHPNDSADDNAVYLAGLEGSLRVYESLLAMKSDARLHFLDDLVRKRDQGQLEQYVAKVAGKKCRS